MNLKKLENRFRIDLKKINRYTNREDLKVVHYTDDGHIEMTNSHIAIRAKNVYESKEQFKHGKQPENYPDMNNLFDQYMNHSVIENIPVKEFEDTIQPFKSLKPEVIHLNFAPNGIFTEIKTKEFPEQDGAKSGLNINLDVNKSFQVTVKYDYLFIILQFIRLLGLEKFDLYYSTAVEMLYLVNDNLEILFMPMRNTSNKVFDGVKKLEEESK